MKEEEDETLDGFDIPLRELTEEESNREITLERFDKYHSQVGEDFVDQHETIVNGFVFGGWLLGKYPELYPEISKILNRKRRFGFPIAQEFLHMYGDEFDNSDDKFYTDLAKFLNIAIAAKKRANQILIQIDEYYGE